MAQDEGFKQEGNWCCISTLILLVTAINLAIAAALRILLDMEDEIHEPLIQGELRNNLTILLYVFCMTFFFGCWFCMCCACRPCRWAADCPSAASKYITRISHKFISRHPRLRRRLSLDDSEIEIDEVVVNHHLTSPPLGNQRSDHYAYENPIHISESVIEREAVPHILPPPPKLALGRLRSMSIDIAPN